MKLILEKKVFVLLGHCQNILDDPRTDANPTSLRNVAFHRLTSEYMQLASGFMQPAAAGRRRNKVHLHCLFEGKNVHSALEWG